MNSNSDHHNIILADNNYITSIGWKYLLTQWLENIQVSEVSNKAELIKKLESDAISLIILDYTMFDFNDVSEIYILQQRFTEVHWLFFSDELSEDFVKNLLSHSLNVSILLKDSYSDEFNSFFKEFQKGNRYVCSHINNLLLNFKFNQSGFKASNKLLTTTETEILKEISLGKTTREIAEKRHISIHTVMTHRKNIFRKLEVNSVYEATKYAIRAGIVEVAEYYI